MDQSGSSEQIVADATSQSLFLRKVPGATRMGEPGCWLGGRPTLPPGIEWPISVFENSPDLPDLPMHFLAQIDLAALADRQGLPTRPLSGTLFFFLDTIFAPTVGAPRGGGTVIYWPEDVTGFPERQKPAIPDVTDHRWVSFWYRDNPISEYTRRGFTFEPMAYPDEIVCDEAGFWKEAVEAILAEQKRLAKLVAREITGRSFAINRMFGDVGPESVLPREDWVTLLLVEHDNDLNFTYGDGEPVRFCIEKSALAAGRFENAVLQVR
jgi:hypothetical protein